MLDPLKYDSDSARVLSTSTCCVIVALAPHFERVFTLFIETIVHADALVY